MTSEKTARKSVVRARSRPSYNCSRASPGHSPWTRPPLTWAPITNIALAWPWSVPPLPFWRVVRGNYVLLGVTSSLIALPVYQRDTLPDERAGWERLRASHLAEIRQAFADGCLGSGLRRNDENWEGLGRCTTITNPLTADPGKVTAVYSASRRIR